MTATNEIFDRSLLRHRRERIAGRANRHDFLLQRVSDDLSERLALINRSFPVALVFGAQNGIVGHRLRALQTIGTVISTECSSLLLETCDRPRLAVDEELLPFASGSLDLVLAPLNLQLVNDLPGVLVQVRRALRGDGLFLAALLGGSTLHELRQAWLTAEAELFGGASPRVAPFADIRDFGALLQRAGFAMPVVDSDTIALTYATPLALMQDIKAMGTSNCLIERSRRPVSRRLLARACDVYASRYQGADGRIPATIEIITMTAWAPHPSQQKPLRPGTATTRLADVLGVPEHKAER